MEIKVTSKYLRISPRKVRPVLHGLRGLTAEEAKTTSAFTNRKAAGMIYDLIKSGIAAAKENYLEPNDVSIKSIYCSEGPRLKRIQPWSKGQARRITKRMSHLTLVLEGVEKVKTDKVEKNIDKVEDINKEENPKS